MAKNPRRTARRPATGGRVTPLEELNPKPEEEKKEPGTLLKSIMDSIAHDEVVRLSFEADPNAGNQYQSIYRDKLKLLPDKFCKRVAIQDDLVASILLARQNHVSPFGRERPDQHSTGFVIEPTKETIEQIEEVEDEREKQARKVDLQRRISAATKKITTCGDPMARDSIGRTDRMTFSQYLSTIVKSGLTVGRFATEILYRYDRQTGERGEPAGWRPVDAGTIYRATPQQQAMDAIRQDAIRTLRQLMGPDGTGVLNLKLDRWERDEYSWVQAIESRPVQVFGDDELKVYNLYDSCDVELEGYPVTPIDTAVNAIITHLNITTHNKLYFQHGRATRGMIVIEADDLTPGALAKVKQAFQANINSVNNSWRMPVFGVGQGEKITWQPIDQGGRDAEFQYLMDQNARVIMTAFMISPEELPGWSYLSRGTNNQALCLRNHSGIWTKDGFQTIGQILGEDDHRLTEVWTGTSWARARVFRTGQKRCATTLLGNGSRLDTSPDHRFRVVGEDGSPAWKRQEELVPGRDRVLVNKRPVTGSEEAVPVYGDRPLTPDMMEVLGWMTGDGNFSVRYHPQTGNTKQAVLSWFYHHEKERDLWERHRRSLETFGLAPKHEDREVSDREADDLKARYGFKSVAPNRLRNRLYNTDFCKWLLSLGFQSSADGKVIPAFVHALPVAHRAAFLRGLFSADGTCMHQRADAVRIVIHDDRLRAQTRTLLGSLGIRTQLHEGLKKQDVDGAERRMVVGHSTLVVKDKVAFYERVGFLQAHKQPRLDLLGESDQRWETVPASVARTVLTGLGGIRNVSRTWVNGCSLTFLRRVAVENGRVVPSWLDDYYCEEVVEAAVLDEYDEMSDVEVFDDLHAFVAEGVVVHNSEGSNEYKLEAARDVGIRPLLAKLEEFLNAEIMPIVDERLAKECRIKLVGLDADTAEKLDVRLQQAQQIHMTYDEVLQSVEKRPIGKRWGGEYPLNPLVQAAQNQFLYAGEIRERFFGIEGASRDPKFAYVRDEFWFQWQQFQLEAQQMQMQAQMAAQQPPPGGGGGEGGGDGGGGGGGGEGGGGAQPDYVQETGTEKQRTEESGEASASPGVDLQRSIAGALEALGKSDRIESVRRAQRSLVDQAVGGFGRDAERVLQELMGTVRTKLPKRRSE